jgi:metal-responsive CopG/Arc/MetJ family transcriptional regulator
MSDTSTAMENRDMDRINVRLDPQLKQQLDSAARAEGVSPSDVVRAALREHLKTKRPQPSCLDIARQIGIVGVYTDAPSDLSTNKEYFEGFGSA